MFTMTLELLSEYDEQYRRAMQCVVGITDKDQQSLAEGNALSIPMEVVAQEANNIVLVHANDKYEAARALGVEIQDEREQNPPETH